jgi:hypothetical protein
VKLPKPMSLRVSVELHEGCDQFRDAGAAFEVLLAREPDCADDLEFGMRLLQGRPQGEGPTHALYPSITLLEVDPLDPNFLVATLTACEFMPGTYFLLMRSKCAQGGHCSTTALKNMSAPFTLRADLLDAELPHSGAPLAQADTKMRPLLEPNGATFLMDGTSFAQLGQNALLSLNVSLLLPIPAARSGPTDPASAADEEAFEYAKTEAPVDVYVRRGLCATPTLHHFAARAPVILFGDAPSACSQPSPPSAPPPPSSPPPGSPPGVPSAPGSPPGAPPSPPSPPAVPIGEGRMRVRTYGLTFAANESPAALASAAAAAAADAEPLMEQAAAAWFVQVVPRANAPTGMQLEVSGRISAPELLPGESMSGFLQPGQTHTLWVPQSSNESLLNVAARVDSAQVQLADAEPDASGPVCVPLNLSLAPGVGTPPLLVRQPTITQGACDINGTTPAAVSPHYLWTAAGVAHYATIDDEGYVAAGSPQAGTEATDSVLASWLATGVSAASMEHAGWLDYVPCRAGGCPANFRWSAGAAADSIEPPCYRVSSAPRTAQAANSSVADEMSIALRQGSLPPNGTLQWSAHASRVQAAQRIGDPFRSDAYLLASDAVVLRPSTEQHSTLLGSIDILQSSLPEGYNAFAQGAPLTLRLLGDGRGKRGGDVDVPLHLERESVRLEGRAMAEGGAAGERLHYTFSLSPCTLGVQGEASESGVMVDTERLLELRVSAGAATAGGVLGMTLQFDMLDAYLGEDQLDQRLTFSLNAAHRRHYVLPQAMDLSQLNVTVIQRSLIDSVPVQVHPPTPHPTPHPPPPTPHPPPPSPHPPHRCPLARCPDACDLMRATHALTGAAHARALRRGRGRP